MKSHEEVVRERLGKIPETMRAVYAKAMSGVSRAAAIKAKCYDCSGWQRKEAHECPAVACPLHPYRPVSDAEGNAPRISVEANGAGAKTGTRLPGVPVAGTASNPSGPHETQ